MRIKIRDAFGMEIAVIPVPDVYGKVLAAGTTVELPTADERAPLRIEVWA